MADIKESKELLISLIEAVDDFSKIMADGKVSLLDLRYVPKLISDLKPGFSGLDKLREEAADYDAEELKELANLGMELAMKLMSKIS